MLFRLLLAAVVTLASSAVSAADVTIRVAADKPAHRVSERMYGIFFEDINFGADGGLSAEQLKNGGFEFPQPLVGWREVRRQGAGSLKLSTDAPWRAANPSFLRLAATSAGGYGAANDGFRGVGVRQGETYEFSVQARTPAGRKQELRVRLVGERGDELAAASLSVVSSDWHRLTATLGPAATDRHAHLELTLAEPGDVDLDAVSLRPTKTWGGSAPGLRADLVQKLADLKPAFFRFPGGCIVEGSQLKYRYQWKLTLGDPADRRLLFNRWNDEFPHRPTPDYYQSFALGFYEYFLLCEDLGAAPLPILNCGMACQFNTGELVPLTELDPFIQDALDLIEFAVGDASTPWGARRAALGHPAPFHLTMLGIGNEQWAEPYFERYEKFAAAIRSRYPQIQLVSGPGPFPTGPDFDYGWSRLRQLDVNLADEHSYAPPDWFRSQATRFDGYARRGPKIFMGEYAAQSIDIVSPDNRNNLRCALAEAAFLTGAERNADVVAMTSYAPLFGHEEAWQWRPNLIWFDSLDSYATPNYYVQQMFSRHRPDVTLPTEIDDPRPRADEIGRVGVGCTGASAEFQELQIEAASEGAEAPEGEKKILWSQSKLSGVEGLERFRGRWELVDGVLRQAGAGEACRAMWGDPRWPATTLTAKARKLDGRGGFSLLFRGSSGGSWLQWNVGGGPQGKHELISMMARHSTEHAVLAEAPGSVEAGRWYDLRVEATAERVKCFLDGKLVHDVAVEPLNLPLVYAVGGIKNGRGAGQGSEVIVKAVNFGEAATARVTLTGAHGAGQAQIIELAGELDAINALAAPTRLTPKTRVAPTAGSEIELTLAPRSLSVIRIPMR